MWVWTQHLRWLQWLWLPHWAGKQAEGCHCTAELHPNAIWLLQVHKTDMQGHVCMTMQLKEARQWATGPVCITTRRCVLLQTVD